MGVILLRREDGAYRQAAPLFINGLDVAHDVCANVKGNCGCLHAEVKAVYAAAILGQSNLTLLCNYSPCAACAAIIVYSKLISDVKFKYITAHDERGIKILRKGGVRCEQIGVEAGTAK